MEHEAYILSFIGNKQIKKELIVREFGHWFLRSHAAERKIGEILARMVKQGTLRRPKRGYYAASRPKDKYDLPGQLSLFD
jgi:hypothetical protein